MFRRIKTLMTRHARPAGAVSVEYALGMLVAAALLAGIERVFFRPMTKAVLDDFIAFVAPPFP